MLKSNTIYIAIKYKFILIIFSDGFKNIIINYCTRTNSEELLLLVSLNTKYNTHLKYIVGICLHQYKTYPHLNK